MTAPTVATCGCEPDSRCEEAQRLWDELIEARDQLRANERSGSRVGRKPAIDEFAHRRDAFHEHRGAA